MKVSLGCRAFTRVGQNHEVLPAQTSRVSKTRGLRQLSPDWCRDANEVDVPETVFRGEIASFGMVGGIADQVIE